MLSVLSLWQDRHHRSFNSFKLNGRPTGTLKPQPVGVYLGVLDAPAERTRRGSYPLTARLGWDLLGRIKALLSGAFWDFSFFALCFDFARIVSTYVRTDGVDWLVAAAVTVIGWPFSFLRVIVSATVTHCAVIAHFAYLLRVI